MTTTTDNTEHDIQPYTGTGSGWASACCLTHKTDTLERWHSLSEAARGFRCDEGRELRFIIESTRGEDVLTSMRDLTGLARVMRGNAEALAYDYDRPVTRAWLWLGGGQLEELQITMQHRGSFGLDDFAYETWTVTRASGENVVTARVRIDGRS